MEKININSASKKDIVGKINEIVDWINYFMVLEQNRLDREMREIKWRYSCFATSEEYTEWLNGQTE